MRHCKDGKLYMLSQGSSGETYVVSAVSITKRAHIPKATPFALMCAGHISAMYVKLVGSVNKANPNSKR